MESSAIPLRKNSKFAFFYIILVVKVEGSICVNTLWLFPWSPWLWSDVTRDEKSCPHRSATFCNQAGGAEAWGKWSRSSKWNDWNNLCPMCAVWSSIVVLKDSLSRVMHRSLPANSLTQSWQGVIVCVPLITVPQSTNFNLDDSLCIREYRCYNFSSWLTRAELLSFLEIWVFPSQPNVFYLGSKIALPCIIACHCGFLELVSFFVKPL